MKIIHSRVFKILIILFILGFILGTITYFVIDNNSVKNNIITYFDLINNNEFNYLNGLVKSISNNYKYLIIIWISGILLISVFVTPLLIIFKSICDSFLITCIISSYGIKGLILSLILLFPCIIINELIYILCSYYSINFSIKEYNAIKKDKMINIRSFTKNYFFIFVIFLFALLLSSLFEIYISSNIIKFVV